jgi:Flp pilus assembly protein CpaB
VQSLQAAQKFVSTRVLATRQGTILLGLGAAALAGILLLAYLNQYRSSVTTDTAPVTVLVAKRLIEQGTSGAEIASSRLFEVREISTEHVKVGALTDAGSLRASVALQDIYPGQQMTVADFTPLGAALGTQLVKDQRAISLPIDTTHGLIGQIQAGDRVDVYGGFTANVGGSDKPVVKLLMQDVLVLSLGAGAEGGIGQQSAGGSNVIVRVNSRQAGELAFANDNGKLWLVLRPRTGAPAQQPRLVTVDNLLFGSRPLSIGP